MRVTTCYSTLGSLYVVAQTSFASAQLLGQHAYPTPTKFLVARQQTSGVASPTRPASTVSSSLTAVSQCHLHGATQFCMAGTQEYQVMTTATGTEALPATYTDCHSHGSDTFCVNANGQDVELTPAGETQDESDHNHSETETGGQNCHFHAGVEHCGSHDESESATRSCQRTDREYNIPLRIGLLFVVLVTSAIGVFGPIALSSFTQNPILSTVLLLLKQFGTGVMISTAFVHLFTHAQLMFSNECLSGITYEAVTSAIVMAGIIVSFAIDYVSHRLVARRNDRHQSLAQNSLDGSPERPKANGDEDGSEDRPVQSAGSHSHQKGLPNDEVGVFLLEAGIIFHSILIGLTLVVAGDSFFLTLFAVIVFHQFFEGLALGSCIAALPKPSEVSGSKTGVTLTQRLLMASAFALITPVGMAIGIGVLNRFNGNDASTLIAIGTLDAFSAGILIWVALVEMLAQDWMHGALSAAPILTTGGAGICLVAGLALMSLLGRWA